jgi:cyclic peptide transporter
MYKQLFRFIFKDIKGSKLTIIILTVIAGTSHGSLLATLNEGVEQIIQAKINPILVIMFISALCIHLITNYYAASKSIILVKSITETLRLRLCDKLLHSNLRNMEELDSGELYTQLTTDVNVLSASVMNLLKSFQATIIVCCGIIYIGWLSLPGLCLTLLTITIGILAYKIKEQSARELILEARAEKSLFYNALHDLLSGFKELRLTQVRAKAMQAQIKQHASRHRQLDANAAIQFIASNTVAQTSILLLLGSMAFIFPAFTTIDPTTLYKFVIAILFLSSPLQTVVGSLSNLIRGQVALQRLNDLEAYLDNNILQSEFEKQLNTNKFDIKLSDVSFSYHTTNRTDNFSIGPLSIDIPQTSIVFISGGNGSGKTTLMKLIAGLYQPDSGLIYFGNQIINSNTYIDYREQFSAIFQDFHLFRYIYGIASNPAMVNDLLKTVALEGKTRYLDKEGFDNLDLSIGQRKRIAYVTARMYDRKVFLFDELAADQDPAFRRYIYETLLPELRNAGKTIIAFTHDDAYFHCCDKLYKLDCGQLIRQPN